MFVALVEQQLQQELPECDGALHDDGEGTGTPKTQVICSKKIRSGETVNLEWPIFLCRGCFCISLYICRVTINSLLYKECSKEERISSIVESVPEHSTVGRVKSCHIWISGSYDADRKCSPCWCITSLQLTAASVIIANNSMFFYSMNSQLNLRSDMTWAQVLSSSSPPLSLLPHSGPVFSFMFFYWMSWFFIVVFNNTDYMFMFV